MFAHLQRKKSVSNYYGNFFLMERDRKLIKNPEKKHIA